MIMVAHDEFTASLPHGGQLITLRHNLLNLSHNRHGVLRNIANGTRVVAIHQRLMRRLVAAQHHLAQSQGKQAIDPTAM